MSEETDNQPAHETVPDQWVQIAGMVLFAVFVVVLFYFGQPPIMIRKNIGSRELDVNLVSCVGILAAIFSVYFLWRYYRSIILMSSVMNTLSIMGAVGLIFHAGFAGWNCVKAGGKVLTPKEIAYEVSDRVRLSPARSERWQIDGQTHLVDATYYLLLSGGLVYVIDYPCAFQSTEGKDDPRALQIAFPLMKHAYEHGFHKRTEFVKPGDIPLELTHIYVALVSRKGGLVTGYRVGLSLAELKALIQQGGPPPIAASRPAS